jgi:hypothetical protein
MGNAGEQCASKWKIPCNYLILLFSAWENYVVNYMRDNEN